MFLELSFWINFNIDLSFLNLKSEEIKIEINDINNFSIKELWETQHEKKSNWSKSFIDLHNDVTTNDIKQAILEGFDRIEHLKRFTTNSMGTDQGKISSINSLGIVSKLFKLGPTLTPTVSNNLNTTFEILFTDDFTGTIQTANTADTFVGMITAGIDASTAGKQWVPAAANNEINLNGEAGAGNATTGGLIGSRIKFTAVAANKYLVEGLLIGDGTVATPFDTQ